MKIKLFIALCLLFLPVNIWANDISEAKQTVRSFYKFDLSHKQDFSKREINRRKGWLSNRLYTLLIGEWKKELSYRMPKSDTKPYFDSLPFQPIDEGCANWSKIGKTSAKKGTVSVEVKFYTSQKCEKTLVAKYKVELVKFKGKWLINDMIYDDGQRLSKTLKRKSN